MCRLVHCIYVVKYDFKLHVPLLDVSQAYLQVFHSELFQNYSRELSYIYFVVRNYAL
jgi:hypothetical protein